MTKNPFKFSILLFVFIFIFIISFFFAPLENFILLDSDDGYDPPLFLKKVIKSKVLPFLTGFVFAQEDRELEIDYPEFGIKPETVKTGLPEYVKYIFNVGIAIVGLIVLGALIWGGFLYLTSTGQPVKLKEARDQIFSAFLGIVILLSSYMIFVTINPQLVMLHLPSIPELIEKIVSPPEQVKEEEMTLIAYEIPLGQLMEKGVWEEKRTERVDTLIKEVETFLKEEIKLNPTFERIADLNKYFKGLTDECQCGNLNTFCTKPQNWSVPIGCSGDPCLEDTRKEMKKILEINEEKMKELLKFKERITEERLILEIEDRKFDEAEEDFLNCLTQSKELFTLNEHLARVQYYEDRGWKVKTIPSYLESRGDPLTFYCSTGGTAFDYPYLPKVEFAPEEFKPPTVPEKATKIEPMSCPAEYPIGEILDNLRQLESSQIIKMERLTILIEEMVTEMRNMADLSSQCNEQNCEANCDCVPNPCYKCCDPVDCGACAAACLSPCLQAVGICVGKHSDTPYHGAPCPRDDIEETSEKIKKIEDEIFSTLKEIKETPTKAYYLLKDKENYLNLYNLRTAFGVCSGPVTEEDLSVFTLNCSLALGNYGPDGKIIGACHPRNFFCCTSSKEALKQAPSFPKAVQKSRPVILPSKEYKPLPSEDNCPKGWACNDDVKYYNQYEDASQPLKEFLACMRERLDAFQKEKELDVTLGRITSISDSGLYTDKCEWETGSSKPPCAHTYGIKKGMEAVSCHYGGINCRYQRASYAVDFGWRDPHERKYVDAIIDAAGQCNPTAYIKKEYDPPHIHISIGSSYGCGCH